MLRQLTAIEMKWVLDEEVGKKELEAPCPKCGLKLTLKTSKYGLFYGCRGWPNCDVLVGCHPGTSEPLGIPADTETRQARIRAHDVFDRLWKGKAAFMSRVEAYRWLAGALRCDSVDAHIGCLSESECELVGEMAEAKINELQIKRDEKARLFAEELRNRPKFKKKKRRK